MGKKAKGGTREKAARLVARFFDRYASGELTVGEAEDIFDRLFDLADEALPIITKRLESVDENERKAAITLLRELDDPRAVHPLRRMLSDADRSDEEKVAIITALNELGETLDEATLKRAIPDPEKMVRDAMMGVLETIEDPGQVEEFLGIIGQGPPEMQAAYVQDFLAPLADRRLLLLLVALLYSEHDEVVLAAIDVVERLKEPAIISFLRERGQYDPSLQVRHAAENAALRLQARIGDRSSQPWSIPTPPPLAYCLLSTIDGDGGQVLFVAREQPEGGFWLLDVMFNDHQGVKDCFSGIAEEDELFDMLDAFDSVDFLDVSLERARAEVTRARQATFEAGRRLPPPLVIWQDWLEGEDSREVEETPLPTLDPSRQAELLEACGELVTLDEFEYWFFNPEEVADFVSSYRKLARKNQAEFGEPAYEELLDEAIEAVVEEKWQRLLPSRLRRQAWLLAQLYEEDEIALWALAAADALERGVLVEHPLLRWMMDASFLNAAEE
ncbi:MAG: HEAT repeat domain-containing protein [Anaerolineae bacterium]